MQPDRVNEVRRLHLFPSLKFTIAVALVHISCPLPNHQAQGNPSGLEAQQPSNGGFEQRPSADAQSRVNEVTNSIGRRLVLIPAGEFDMGSHESEEAISAECIRSGVPATFVKPEFFRPEFPQHTVKISHPFYMGVYEVTQAEYQAVMLRNPSSHSKQGPFPQFYQDKDTSRYPVEKVKWTDAATFCERLSARREERSARRVYRLPSTKRFIRS